MRFRIYSVVLISSLLSTTIVCMSDQPPRPRCMVESGPNACINPPKIVGCANLNPCAGLYEQSTGDSTPNGLSSLVAFNQLAYETDVYFFIPCELEANCTDFYDLAGNRTCGPDLATTVTTSGMDSGYLNYDEPCPIGGDNGGPGE